MKDPDWAKVLNYLYEQNEIKYSQNNCLNEPHSMVKNTDISADDPGKILRNMMDNNLVDYETTQSDEHVIRVYTLSKKGFDVAHEREIAKSQQQTNRRSARLSAYLVVAIILQSLVAITQHDGGWEVILLGLIILGLIFVVLAELNEELVDSLIKKCRSLF